MWCILKCHPGKTEKVIKSCRSEISHQILRDIFVFTSDRMKRYEGNWHVEKKQLFPDCIFVETQDPDVLEEQLEPCRTFLQASKEGSLVWLVPSEEEEFLKELCGNEHHLCMSQGYIRNGIPHVIHGPLVGMERRIRKIDRHKRTANVEMPAGKPGTFLLAGLEITSKS